MLFFRKNKKRKGAYVKIPLPKWLRDANQRFQQKLVNKLSRIERRLNTRQKKVAVIAFCTTMVFFFTIPLINSFRSRPNANLRLFKHETITRAMDSRLDDTLNLELLKQLKIAKDHKKTDSITP